MLVIVFVVAGCECSHTDLVKLKDVGLCAHLAEEALSGLAVRAVGLGEDGDGVLVDDGLDLGLCSGHCGGRGGAREEVTQEGNFGGSLEVLEVGEYCVW